MRIHPIHLEDVRKQLPQRPEPYWVQVKKGFCLGYRRNLEAGTWILRKIKNGERSFQSLGTEEELSYEEAEQKVLEAAGIYNHLLKAKRSENLIYPDIPGPQIELENKAPRVPATSGVYFLWDIRDRKVVYVGQSVDMRNRLSVGSHPHAHPGDYLSLIEFPEEDLLYAEHYYIGLLRPIRNANKPRKTCLNQKSKKPSATTPRKKGSSRTSSRAPVDARCQTDCS